jgi:hypothetical protein
VNTFETRNPETIYTVDRGEKNLTVGSSKLVDSEFRDFGKWKFKMCGCTNFRHPKPRNAERICAVDLRKI